MNKDGKYVLLPVKPLLSRLLGKPVHPDFRVNSIDFRFITGETRIFLWGVNKQPNRLEDDPSDNYEVLPPDGTIFVCLENSQDMSVRYDGFDSLFQVSFFRMSCGGPDLDTIFQWREELPWYLVGLISEEPV